MVQKTIFLPKDKQLTITTDAFTSGYFYTKEPGEEPVSFTTISESETKIVKATKENRQFVIRSNRELTTSIEDANTDFVEVKTYTTTSTADLYYNTHLINNESTEVVLTLPAASSVVPGYKITIVGSATDAAVFHDIRIASSGQFYLGHATATHDAIAFKDGTFGANVTLISIDSKWVVIDGSNFTPYSD